MNRTQRAQVQACYIPGAVPKWPGGAHSHSRGEVGAWGRRLQEVCTQASLCLDMQITITCHCLPTHEPLDMHPSPSSSFKGIRLKGAPLHVNAHPPPTTTTIQPYPCPLLCMHLQ